MKTKRGVYLNIDESPIKRTIYCGIFDIDLYFTSEFYKKNFDDRLCEFIDNTNNSLYGRFKVAIDTTILSALRLYSNIEKRGFKVRYGGEVYKCLDDIMLTIKPSY